MVVTVALLALPLFAGGAQQAADMFAEMVEEGAGGRIQISVYPDSQLSFDSMHGEVAEILGQYLLDQEFGHSAHAITRAVSTRPTAR